jgi:hypothetical protein
MISDVESRFLWWGGGAKVRTEYNPLDCRPVIECLGSTSVSDTFRVTINPCNINFATAASCAFGLVLSDAVSSGPCTASQNYFYDNKYPGSIGFDVCVPRDFINEYAGGGGVRYNHIIRVGVN